MHGHFVKKGGAVVRGAFDALDAPVCVTGAYEPYAWHNYRGYISDRHRGGSNACFVDGHAERIIPKDVYQDNRSWNGLGFEDPELDPHVDERHDPNTGEFRYDVPDPCQP